MLKQQYATPRSSRSNRQQQLVTTVDPINAEVIGGTCSLTDCIVCVFTCDLGSRWSVRKRVCRLTSEQPATPSNASNFPYKSSQHIA